MSKPDTSAELRAPTGKPFPWRCPRCRHKEVRPVTIPFCCERLHEGQLLTIDVPNLVVPRCGNCDELVFDYTADEQIQDAFLARIRGDRNGVTPKAQEELVPPAYH